MFKNLPTLERLIRQLQRIPYVASKNIYRVALYFLETDDVHIERLCAVILEAKKNIKRCTICCNFSEGALVCCFCENSSRDKSQVCVVETWHDLVAIEKAGGYTGVYHVLGGALSPLEGIGVDDLSVSQLIERIKQGVIKEVIFATNPTPEGEATASYIASKIQQLPLVISKLASGVPIGSNLGSMDRVTVYKALLGRRPF